jgi:hypothetical protein
LNTTKFDGFFLALPRPETKAGIWAYKQKKHKQMTIYTLEACEQLIQRYIDAGGEAETVTEGCLGLGVVVLRAKGKKTAVIREVYLSAWSSGHTIRLYNKEPKKYTND